MYSHPLCRRWAALQRTVLAAGGRRTRHSTHGAATSRPSCAPPLLAAPHRGAGTTTTRSSRCQRWCRPRATGARWSGSAVSAAQHLAHTNSLLPLALRTRSGVRLALTTLGPGYRVVCTDDRDSSRLLAQTNGALLFVHGAACVPGFRCSSSTRPVTPPWPRTHAAHRVCRAAAEAGAL